MTLGLTERYVATVVRSVPKRQRDDVAAELRASIDDAVDGLVAAGAPRSMAEHTVVSEFGEPGRLAAQYGGHPGYLIGPAFYHGYARLLRALLLIVVPIIGIVTLLAEAIAEAGPVEVLLASIGAMFQVGVQMAFWVTLVFALLDRSGGQPKPAEAWSPEDLPEEPDRRIGMADTVWSVALLTWAAFAIFWSREHWLITTDAGEEVPVLNPDLWDVWLPVLVVVLLASIVLEIAKFRTGRWTVPLAITNTVLNVAFAGIVVLLWISPGLINPVLTEAMSDDVAALLGVLPWIVVVIAFADTVEGWWRLRRG